MRLAGGMAGLRRALGHAAGMVLDIDGVLLRGRKAIPGAREALEALHASGVPFCLLTNGGGMTERDKADAVERILGMPARGAVLRADNVVLNHTPMLEVVRRLVSHPAAPVLVAGRGDCEGVARSAGLLGAVSSRRVHAALPGAWTHSGDPLPGAAAPHPDGGGVPGKVEAVVVMHDPDDWGRDIQICLDMIFTGGKLVGSDGKVEVGDVHGDGREQRLPVFFAATDLEFAGDFARPRFGMGAFQAALSGLFRELTGGRTLSVQRFGKPAGVAFEAALERLRGQNGGHVPDHVYMVGDNVHTDIQGSLAMPHPGPPLWTPVLVQTGVYKHANPSNAPLHDRVRLVPDLRHAVDHVVSSHGRRAP